MKLSFLVGLIEAGGSASYLNSSSSDVSSVHVHCKLLSQTKSLTMEHHFAPGKITYLDVAKSGANNKATHVVSRIQYGAGATFTLKAKKIQSTKDTNIQGKLEIAADQLIKVIEGGKVNIKLNKKNDNFEDNFVCDFKSDGFLLGPDVSIPTTFNEALVFTKDLIGIMSTAMNKDVDGNPLGVPQRIWLTPLVQLPGAETAPVFSPLKIGNVIANDFVDLMDDLDQLVTEANGLIDNPLTKKLSVFEKKFIQFRGQLLSYKLDLQQQLKQILVLIQGSCDDDGVNELENLYQSTNSSAFELKGLRKWITDKQFELSLIKRFTNQFPLDEKKLAIFPSKQKITKKITTESGRTSFHFIFSSLADVEPLLRAMECRVAVSDDHQKLWATQKGMAEFVV